MEANMKSIRLAVSSLVILAGLSCGMAQDKPEWGKPFKGVVAGLRAPVAKTAEGQPLTLRVEIFNPGNTEVMFPNLGRFEAWRLQFESDAGKLYEFVYSVRDARLRPLELAPGDTASIELPLMRENIIGTFKPVPGLTELPAGRYRVRAFVPFFDSTDKMPKLPLGLELGTNQPNWLISNYARIEITGAAGGEGEGWILVGDDLSRQHYRKMPEKEEVFTGTLEKLPPPAGASTLMRNHAYRLGDRLIPGRSLKALDALAGKKVELRGKRIDMNLEGIELHEIVPGAIRAAGE